MGYHTYVGIEDIYGWVDGKAVPFTPEAYNNIIASLRKYDETFEFAFDQDGWINHEVKWYHGDELMCKFTKENPCIMVILHGEGDESDDIWNAAYCNGLMERVEMIMPDLTFKQWKKED